MSPMYSDTQRMALRSQVLLASEIVSGSWPMRTFIHHNPLHELEALPFEEAIRRTEGLRSGHGFLRNDQYRRYFRQGRIAIRHVDAVLRPLAAEQRLHVGNREVSHLDVLRAHLLSGITAPPEENLEKLVVFDLDGTPFSRLMDRLQPVLPRTTPEERSKLAVREDLAALGRTMTLSSWCDHAFGTDLVERINVELTQWIATFVDEGQAAWSMPQRERTLYGTWKGLAGSDWKAMLWGIRHWSRHVAALPDRPEDALLDGLAALGVPEDWRVDYLALQIAVLPGWAAYIKWRAAQQAYPWQHAYPADLVKYLAIRLFYEQHLTQQVCLQELGMPGTFQSIRTFVESYPLVYYLRLQRVAGRLPVELSRQIDRLRHRELRNLDAWDAVAARYLAESVEPARRAALRSAAWQLIKLGKELGIAPATLLEVSSETLLTALGWLEAFPETEHGPRWLEAFEQAYQEPLLAGLTNRSEQPADAVTEAGSMRPQAQAVFCIDVRSEPLRRHLETIGNYETFGFAGFFICFIRYQGLGEHEVTEQYPVIAKGRNLIREIPRSYHGEMLKRHRSGARIFQAAQGLIHDLKENVITPYVMVESIGWLYSLPFFGKSFWPEAWRKASDWIKRRVAPPVATTLTVDKLSKNEAEEMVAHEQCATVRRALRERLGLHGSAVAPDVVEALRRRALNGEGSDEALKTLAARLVIPIEIMRGFIHDLRRRYRIDQRWADADKERITRTGLTIEEQVFTVETALRMMGLTKDFARLVLFCAHGSTSENNPFESALDCGACGGNQGKPNARLLAAMANRPLVRERLAKNGLRVPADTHFLAGQIDTTTDQIELLDLEDVPATHRKDLARLLADLREAGRLNSQERCRKLPDVAAVLSPERAATQVCQRSSDWSQVRPEWGLSGNATFIIARRQITKGLNLEGRAFLHSYDHHGDESGRLLEVVMTAPQVVTQWINMEHYFSTVDNELFGSGSKIYHNVVGRLGIMSGTISDLRTGLAQQTVMNGEIPYHEPMRLLTIIEAPRTRVEQLIKRHELLQHFYHNRWVHLVVLEPEDQTLYRYLSTGEWRPENQKEWIR